MKGENLFVQKCWQIFDCFRFILSRAGMGDGTGIPWDCCPGTPVPGLGLGPGLISLGRLGLGRISLGRPGTWDLLGICVPTSPKGHKLLENSLILTQE